MTTVLCLWDAPGRLRDHLAAGLADAPGVRMVWLDDPTPEQLVARAPEADVMIGWRPTRALLDAAGRLKVFINPGVGVQHLLPLFRDLAGRRDVVLVNGHGNTVFTAQHAVALLLALTNRIVPHHRWMAAGAWRKGDADAASIPLRGRTIGLLGYGHINRKVHRFLAGFDVTFAALRRSWPADAGDRDLVRFTDGQLDAFLDHVDTLIVAVPLTERTEGMLGADALRRLGRGGLLVNVARGPVIDEDALFEALDGGALAGAALDVWYDYRPEPDGDGRRFPYHRPFHALDNVVLSPHRAASPFDDLARWDEVIENLHRVAAGRDDLLNVVDLERGY